MHARPGNVTFRQIALRSVPSSRIIFYRVAIARLAVRSLAAIAVVVTTVAVP